MAEAEMSAITSTSDEKRPRRRRKTTRCCGLYSPMTPRGGDHPAFRADRVDEQSSAMAMAVRESRGMVHAFATSTKIHGMKNIYRAQGE